MSLLILVQICIALNRTQPDKNHSIGERNQKPEKLQIRDEIEKAINLDQTFDQSSLYEKFIEGNMSAAKYIGANGV